MHVDGSVVTQMFGIVLFKGPLKEDGVKTNVYLIKNGKIADVPGEVRAKIGGTAGTAFSTLMTWQSYGDLYRFTLAAKQEGMNLKVAFIPHDVDESRKGEFENPYMNPLVCIPRGLPRIPLTGESRYPENPTGFPRIKYGAG
jgi:hypothetical protein